MTITLTNFFGLLGGLLVLAYLANRFAHRTRVPDVMVLLVCGIILGPVLHWVDVNSFPKFIRGVGTLALILILFAAGLELDLRRARKQFLAGTLLAIVSYALTMEVVHLLCMWYLHMSRMASLLAAAALACMSGSIVLPILDQMRIRDEVKTTLVIESAFGDGLGALVVGVLLSLIASGANSDTSGGTILSGMLTEFLFRFALAFVIGVVSGYLWARLLPKISNRQFWQVLTFGAVLIIYSGTHAIGGSDLFAVMVFGATLTSVLGPESFWRDLEVDFNVTDESSQIHSFHSELAFLVRNFFFVMLGASIQFRGLQEQLIPSLEILAVILLARLIAVQFSRIAWRGLAWREQELATTLIPRGLITAVLGLEALNAMPQDLHFFPSLIFALILLTNGLGLVATFRAKAVEPEADTRPAMQA
ncbi:MAG: cation:proton antiporter [Acidobacteriota bacterium]|nr:cation:proton antiporter [Acidobacteriota bacterium]